MSPANHDTVSPANRDTAVRAAWLRRRDEEDAAAVLAVVAVLAAEVPPEPVAPTSVWSDPAHRLGRPLPGRQTWWASASRRGRS